MIILTLLFIIACVLGVIGLFVLLFSGIITSIMSIFWLDVLLIILIIIGVKLLKKKK